MPPAQILFIVVAAATLGAALMVVTTSNLVHSALWLVVALFGIAAFYVLLDAGFLAVAQVVVYIGAIAILMIFAIMLTRRVARQSDPQFNGNWPWGIVISAVVFAGLFWMLNSWPAVNTVMPVLSPDINPLTALGEALVSPNAYVLPFEVASVLLMAALIGSIFIAWNRK
jgi:NADH-quinone oxidoreductase subunit J